MKRLTIVLLAGIFFLMAGSITATYANAANQSVQADDVDSSDEMATDDTMDEDSEGLSHDDMNNDDSPEDEEIAETPEEGDEV